MGIDRAVHAWSESIGTTELRAVVDALLYIARTGGQWRALPDRFPPVSTVQRYFHAWRDSGLWKTINFHLVAAARLAPGRGARPSASIIDSQSAKTTDVAGLRIPFLIEEAKHLLPGLVAWIPVAA